MIFAGLLKGINVPIALSLTIGEVIGYIQGNAGPEVQFATEMYLAGIKDSLKWADLYFNSGSHRLFSPPENIGIEDDTIANLYLDQLNSGLLTYPDDFNLPELVLQEALREAYPCK